MEFVDVEVPCKFPGLFCSVCGHVIWRRGGDVEQTQCEHVLFVFDGCVNDFTYASPACKQVAAETMEVFDRDVHIEPVEYALWHIDPLRDRGILRFSITTFGGDELRIISVAIDFNPPEDTTSEPAAGETRKAKTAKKRPTA